MPSYLPRSIAFALAALSLAGSLFAAAPKAPNVVVILCDDLGYGDVGFNGSKYIATPGLSRIAAGGIVFTNAYVTHPNGSASRAGVLTGRYPQRFGLERSIAWRPQDPAVGLPAEEKTLAEVLRPLGYTTGLIGKWHMGAHDNFHPNNRGFDEFFGFLGGGLRYFPDELNLQNTYQARTEPESYRTWIQRGMQPVRTKRYVTEDFTAEAIDFVRRQSDKPFFLLLSYHATRAPLQAPEKEIAAFAGAPDERRRIYAAMLTVMDRGVEQLLDVLDSLEIADDTLLFFMSTSGGDMQSGGAKNGSLRGQRGEIYEGGIRVPFVVRWPRAFPAGTTYSQPVSAMDIFATAAAAAGAQPDPRRPLDGVDLAPYVRNEKKTPPHESIFLRIFDAGNYAVRSGDYKLIKIKNSAPVLYNLARDPAEKTNIAERDPERLRALQDSFTAWNAQMIDPTIPGVPMSEWKQPSR